MTLLSSKLFKRVDEQRKYINNKLEERDRKLMESLRGLQETKKELAAATEKKSWWKKLFS
jgi:F0F1-type ATP synthase membrane subunit b/b'